MKNALADLEAFRRRFTVGAVVETKQQHQGAAALLSWGMNPENAMFTGRKRYDNEWHYFQFGAPNTPEGRKEVDSMKRAGDNGKRIFRETIRQGRIGVYIRW